MFSRLIESLKQSQIDRLVEETRQLEPVACLRKYIDIHLDDLLNNPAYQAYFVLAAGSVAVSADLKPHIQQTHVYIRDIMVDFIRQGQQSGQLASHLTPEEYASSIGNYLMGVAMHFHITGAEAIETLRAGAYLLIDAMEQQH